ncbi:MAG: putative glycosyl/glycerophosphate transferase, partial [Microbacteriaceae bacterium]|nr:putative glycosyl/glycerophosphate transferase [Microbacteriaceae bacterium]
MTTADIVLSVPTIDVIDLDFGVSPALLFEGAGKPPTELALRGSRQELAAEILSRGSRWQARLPLLSSRWLGPLLAPRSGSYELVIGQAPVALAYGVELPAPQLILGVTRISFAAAGDSLVITFEAPLTDRERGALQQAALESDYRAARYEPINGVFFESFYGRNASCNPLAIDRALARLRPDVARYWSVSDASVQVPDGSVALIEGSAEWWRIRG